MALERHLLDFRYFLAILHIQEFETELAKQRQQATLPKEGEKGFQTVSSSNELNTGQARDIVAKTIGV